MKSILRKPDTFGAMASTLCVIHCLATPFIFITQCCVSQCCDSSPVWWQSLDYIFLLISFFAIAQSVKKTTKPIMKPLLWVMWFCLFCLLINQKTNWFLISKNIKHFFAISLALLHLYNLKFCQCKKDKCCI